LVNEDLSLALDDEIRVVALLGEGRSELVNGTPGAWAAYSSTRLGFGSLDLWVAASEVESFFRRLSASARRLGGGSIDGAAWTSARIALGIPLVGVDFDETVSPLEAGLDGRAVSFSKGCYLGQEIVARQHRGGGLAQRLVQFEVDGVDSVPAGSRLFDSAGAEVGRVTSSARRTAERGNMLALGYLKASLAQPGACVTVGSRTIRVRCLVGRHDSAGARQTG
jgi:folate-binding protein YgfZ